MFCLEPAGADAELDPAAAHRVDLRHGDGERTGQAEGRRGHQGAEPDPAGFPCQSGQRRPGVGRAGAAVAVAHVEVVVGAEEGPVSAVLGAARHRQQLVIAGALLRFGEVFIAVSMNINNRRAAGEVFRL